ncbi:Actin-related protein 6, partial [Linum grandiflorum]
SEPWEPPQTADLDAVYRSRLFLPLPTPTATSPLQDHHHHHHPSMSNVVVLDNGGGLIKAGHAGDSDPTTVIPNCLYRPLSSKKFIHPSPLNPSSATTEDLTSAAVRRPIDRGYLINPELEREIWSHLFSLLRISPPNSGLLLTEPLFSLPSIQRSTDELVFEDFGFASLHVADPAKLVHVYEASRRPERLVSRAQCSVVVDCGFSFTHAVPVYQNVALGYAAKRIDLGGKALTNYLKELVSYRSVNVMDQSFIIDDVKERLCFVSLDVSRDLQIARRRGKDNLFKCTYVLPDGITHTKGFVKDPEEANRYLTLTHDGPSSDLSTNEADDHRRDPAERKKTDLTKNEFDLTNERFLVPEMLFHPVDLGLNQAGLAECIVRAINSCSPLLHPVLYESIILTGGSTLFPRFAERLELELRPLVPEDYQVKIITQEEYI